MPYIYVDNHIEANSAQLLQTDGFGLPLLLEHRASLQSAELFRER